MDKGIRNKPNTKSLLSKKTVSEFLGIRNDKSEAKISTINRLNFSCIFLMYRKEPKKKKLA